MTGSSSHLAAATHAVSATIAAGAAAAHGASRRRVTACAIAAAMTTLKPPATPSANVAGPGR
jgi:hypothetical protein